MTICTELDIPATPIYGLDELPEHPQLKAVNLFRAMDHPSEGAIRYVRPTTKFAATPASVREPAPRLGQHSREVLLDSGLTEDEVDSLVADGIAVQG
jgi:formyl-CoA transferase